MSTMKSVSVFASATVANVACGFDSLGFAIHEPGDLVTVSKGTSAESRITEITGDGGRLPLGMLKNTAGVAIHFMMEELKRRGHPTSNAVFDIHIDKQMPLGSGLGSSAASSVAAVVAANEFLQTPFTRKELLPFVMQSEKVACGAAHADNVAPALLGGFILVRSYDPLDVVSLHVPSDLYCAVLHPHIELLTEDARKILKKNIRLDDAIIQWSNLAGLITDFEELSGDRRFGEDHAIVGGLGRFRGRAVVVMGHEKGNDTQTRLKHNFGMARPEGYRKAVRLMDMADKFGLPVLTFVDTAGAYPGVGAEERGQSEAIARSTERCLTLGTPLISVITGEGGSGGAVALASANTVLMLEHSIYSVISPEGCASILWRDGAKARDAAIAMKITAQDLIQLKIIDGIIQEPVGGAHRDRDGTIKAVGDAVEASLSSLEGLDPATLRKKRRDRFLAIGRTLMEPAA